MIATRDEYESIRDLVSAGTQSTVDDNTGHCEYRYSHRTSSGKTYNIQMLVLGGQGELLASSVLMNALRDRTRSPLAVVSIGISMSLSGDVRLGDVVFATSIKRYLERARVNDKDFGEPGGKPQPHYDLHFAGVAELPMPSAIEKLKHFPHTPEQEKPHADWQGRCSRDTRGHLGNALADHVAQVDKKLGDPPKLHAGPAFSGPLLVDSKAFKEKLLHDVGRIGLVLDMESGGLVSCSKWIGGQCRPQLTVVIRGASDFGDGTKKTYEASLRAKGLTVPEGPFARVAMRHAYFALLMLCEAGWLVDPK
jgi:nucleoside phosphorylase